MDSGNTNGELTFLVTGAGGFIGSHLTELLLAQGYRVRALVRYNGRGDCGHLQRLSARWNERLELHFGDVTDHCIVNRLVTDVDIVLHLAALIGIPYSYVAPVSYLETNVRGTLNVLEACRHAKVKRLVVTSTSEVYGTALYTPIDEKHPLQGQSPYSASKIGADKLAEAYFRSFDVPVVTLRPFNTYGPRQSARAVIPTVLIQAISGAPHIKLGNLDSSRDLTFVEDTARAFLLAAVTPGIEGETIHFGQGSAVDIRELANLILKITKSDAELVTTLERQRPQKSEVEVLLCDPSKARRLLGWEPNTALYAGLEKTAEYVLNNMQEYNAKDYII